MIVVATDRVLSMTNKFKLLIVATVLNDVMLVMAVYVATIAIYNDSIALKHLSAPLLFLSAFLLTALSRREYRLYLLHKYGGV